MSRDEIWDALKEDGKRRRKNWQANNMSHANNIDDGKWTKHTPFHWSRDVDGHRLDYWPSTKKHKYKGEVRNGSPRRLITPPKESANA